MKKFLPILLFIGSASAQEITDQRVSEYIKGAVAESGYRQLDTLNSKTPQPRLRQNPEETTKIDIAQPAERHKIFGHEIFGTRDLTFTPNQNIATPANYTLGAGDEVIIDIWGANQTTIREVISPDGYINIDGLGLVYLNGKSIAEAERYLQRALAAIYSSVADSNGDEKSHLKLTLGKIRTIEVHVMGEVAKPGSYSLSSLATAFYALYRAGGVSDLGSVRDIRIVRNGREVATIDIYDFIMKGKSEGNIHLQDGDMIIVPPYRVLIDAQGAIKRPLKYELADGETLSALLDYAGGFMGDAYQKSVTVTRRNGREYQIYTVDNTAFDNFRMMDGDIVDVGPMIDRFANRLEVKGAVYRQGVYQLNDQINTISKLIAKAEGLRGDALLSRAILQREKEDLTRQTIQVDLGNILNGTAEDIELKRGDILYIPSIHDLQRSPTIEIFGHVARPGVLPYSENSTLEDVIIQAGGLLPSASTVRVDISRQSADSSSTEHSEVMGEQFSFAIKDGFVVGGDDNFILKPYDRIYVRKSPAYQEPQSVKIAGEVLYSGEYALSKKSERLSDLIKKAGGVTPFAYIKGARLTRKMNREERERQQSVLTLAARNIKDSIDIQSLPIADHFNIGIDLERALSEPGSDADLVLRADDELQIPQYNNTVRISGCVMSPNTVSYAAGKRVKYYIGQAGGFAQHARKKSSYIVYMNGQIRRVKSNSRDIIEPGCQIVVPTKERSADALQSILSVATTSASLATMIATIGNILK